MAPSNLLAPPDLRASGIPVVGSVGWGTHLCHFFKDREDLVDGLVPYFSAGLEANERCLWLASRPLDVAAGWAALGRAVPDLEERRRRGQIEILDRAEWSRRDAHLAPSQVIEGWLEREREAVRDGFAGLRLSGNSIWLDEQNWSGFAQYEALVHDAFRDARILAVCSYAIDRCGANEIIDVLRNHKFALVRQHGSWHTVHSAAAMLALAEASVTPAHGHAVELYTTEAHFPAERIAGFLRESVTRGEGAVIVATARHREAIVAALDPDGLLGEALVTIDADQVHAVMARGPASLFDACDEVLGAIVGAVLRERGAARVYGELVDVFCRHQDRQGAIDLERWWNGFVARHPVELLCGYSYESFADGDATASFQRVCEAHVAVSSGEAVEPRAAQPSRLRAELRQASIALEREARLRLELEDAREHLVVAERQAREHLSRLQRVTSALSESVARIDIARVVAADVTSVLEAPAILVGPGELGPPPPAVIAPLVVAGRQLGALAVALPSSGETGSAFRALFDDICRQVALALDRASSYERAQRERWRAERLREEAEQANRAKDEFLAMLGHELRNPLSPILTAVQLMRLRGVDVFIKERTIIERQVNHMGRLVDDLLDIARITRGRVELRRAPVELARVVAQAVETASPLLEERAHRLHVGVASVGLVVSADLNRLAQVVANLLTNAAKYTPPGGTIEIRARVEPGRVVLAVKDDGVGIEPELLPQVFGLFVQGRQAMDRSKGGLGLGLAIARTLVELHGGTLSGSSEGAGLGSTFKVELPLLEGEVASSVVSSPAAESSRQWPSQRVLIVDDNRDAALLLAEALSSWGHNVRVAHDGPGALEVAAAFHPDVALLDIGLPVMDGYELALRLRSCWPERAPRLVAVTGYGQETDHLRSRTAGFDAHLVKPVELQMLRATLETLARR